MQGVMIVFVGKQACAGEGANRNRIETKDKDKMVVGHCASGEIWGAKLGTGVPRC
jgi:hypothetical protein